MLGQLYNSIGELHRVEHNYQSALSFYQKALSIFKTSFRLQLKEKSPDKHTDKHIDRYVDKSEANPVDTLPVYIAIHPYIAEVEGNIAMTLYSQGKYLESKSYFQLSLMMRQQLFSLSNKNHITISSSLNNYAGTINISCYYLSYHSTVSVGLLFSLGAYAEALPMYEKSLQIKLAIYGNDQNKPQADIASSYVSFFY